ncbi:MAG: helix-turn-helix domain-containing protein [Chloroflexi bacterium]|nr:helix-turn-helix domain-containing protein [Chloroflexota bacterium]
MWSSGVVATDLSVAFGRVLREHRQSARLTQEGLAERAGVSPRSISELERGAAHIPRRDTVSLLVRALSLSGSDRDEFQALVDRQRQNAVRPARADSHGARLRWRAPARTPRLHNLPRSLDAFFGHDRALHELGALLATTPLVTLVGGGGVGKTRLAHELGWRQVSSRAEIWLVELAGLDDPGLLVPTIASAVGAPGRDVRLDALSAYLHARPVLLLLDNCEHLVQACAEVVAQLLRRCPRLRVLATSREPLGIAGEVIWSVGPLDCPETVEQIERAAAARLFVERARAVSPGLRLSPVNALGVVRICQTVEGNPLALELAAARTRTVAIAELAERLADDARILRRRLHPGRRQHEAIWAVIAWSYRQLSRDERVVLERVAAFHDDCTLDMAEDACAASSIPRDRVMDVLGRLVDKSLVSADTSGARARYRISGAVRRYAADVAVS